AESSLCVHWSRALLERPNGEPISPHRQDGSARGPEPTATVQLPAGRRFRTRDSRRRGLSVRKIGRVPPQVPAAMAGRGGMPPEAAKPGGETKPARPPPDPRAARKRKLLIGGVGVLVLAALLVFGIPWLRTMLSTVSTDDAFVNGYVTFVAARVRGQVSRVLVEDNNRVHKGDLLVQLD